MGQYVWVCQECIAKHSLPVPADLLIYVARPTCVVCETPKPRDQMVYTERRFIGEGEGER
jgi:hypothetical protein